MGSGIKITHDEFILKLKSIHPNLKLIGRYVRMKDCVNIIDENGILYISRAQDLIKGKKPTIESSENKNTAFEIKARLIHGDLYDYSKVDYSNARTCVIVICKLHGEFLSHPDRHINSGSGCHKCGEILCRKGRDYNDFGWDFSRWENQSKKSKLFESFKLYVVKCFNENESFIKIGRTFRDLKYRFEDKNKMPYNWEVLTVIEGTAKFIFDLENKIKHIFKNKKHFPLKYFNGNSECFNVNEVNKIIKRLDLMKKESDSETESPYILPETL